MHKKFRCDRRHNRRAIIASPRRRRHAENPAKVPPTRERREQEPAFPVVVSLAQACCCFGTAVGMPLSSPPPPRTPRGRVAGRCHRPLSSPVTQQSSSLPRAASPLPPRRGICTAAQPLSRNIIVVTIIANVIIIIIISSSSSTSMPRLLCRRR